MASSRIGPSLRGSSRLLISAFHSGTFDSCDAVYRSHELFPPAPLGGEYFSAFTRQLVVTAAALTGLLDPSALDPSALLEPVQQRIKRRDVESKHAVRASLDQLADFVAVPGPDFNQRQDQQLSAALLQLAVKH